MFNMDTLKDSLHYFLYQLGVGTLLEYPLIVVLSVSFFILLCAKISNHFITKFLKFRYQGANEKVLFRLKTVFIYVIAGYGILSMIKPFRSIMSLLLASGGVLAVVIGLATQEAAGNFVNGIMITIFKPFKIGDLIKLNNGELVGFVTDITIRHTIIKTYENTSIVIPNSVIDKAILENITTVGEQKANFLLLQISYESNLDLALQIIKEEIMRHPHFLDARTKEEIQENCSPVVTRLTAFLDSGIELKTAVYSKNNAEGFAMLSDLRIAIKKRFDAAGIEIPYPQCTISYKNETHEN